MHAPCIRAGLANSEGMSGAASQAVERSRSNTSHILGVVMPVAIDISGCGCIVGQQHAVQVEGSAG